MLSIKLALSKSYSRGNENASLSFHWAQQQQICSLTVWLSYLNKPQTEQTWGYGAVPSVWSLGEIPAADREKTVFSSSLSKGLCVAGAELFWGKTTEWREINLGRTTHVTLTTRGPSINFDLRHDWRKRVCNWPLVSRGTIDGLIGRGRMDIQLWELEQSPAQSRNSLSSWVQSKKPPQSVWNRSTSFLF